MTTLDPRPCCCWKNRFTEPTIEQILGEIPAADVELVNAFHSRMTAISGVAVRMHWFGDGWYWTVGYHLEGDVDDEPVAVLIPAPEDVKAAMPVDPEFTKRISMSRLKRSIRDGLELAVAPYDARWAVWSLQPGTFLDDLMNLVQRKVRFLSTRSESAT